MPDPSDRLRGLRRNLRPPTGRRKKETAHRASTLPEGRAHSTSRVCSGTIAGYEMEEDELFIFIISAGVAIFGAVATATSRLHWLYLRGNPAVGLVRLSVWASMAWIAFVIWRYADPSVTGPYVLFYLVMGYAVVKLFGQFVGAAFGPRFRIDVCERRNLAAAVFLAAIILSTGLVFGGSLWGEADPLGDDEGGWWIPLGFFLLGWGTFACALGLFLWREPGRAAARLRRERSLEDARAGATYALGTAWIVTETVAGDFYGWWHGLLAVGVVAVMLGAHEMTRTVHIPGGPRIPAPSPVRRWMESFFYLFCGVATWSANRLLDRYLGPGV
jgi:hypothetical protein